MYVTWQARVSYGMHVCHTARMYLTAGATLSLLA